MMFLAYSAAARWPDWMIDQSFCALAGMSI
jgi:hypothetical protein